MVSAGLLWILGILSLLFFLMAMWTIYLANKQSNLLKNAVDGGESEWLPTALYIPGYPPMITSLTLWLLASLSILFFLCAVVWSIYTVNRKENVVKDRNNNSNRDVEKATMLPTKAVNLPSDLSIKRNNQSRMDHFLFIRSLYSIDSNDESSSSSDEDISEWTTLLSAFHDNTSVSVTQGP